MGKPTLAQKGLNNRLTPETCDQLAWVLYLKGNYREGKAKGSTGQGLCLQTQLRTGSTAAYCSDICQKWKEKRSKDAAEAMPGKFI